MPGNIVKPTAGRETYKYMLVTAVSDGYAMLVDGKSRKLDKPKRKKLKHLEVISTKFSIPGEKISLGVTDREIRKALAAYRAMNGSDSEEGR